MFGLGRKIFSLLFALAVLAISPLALAQGEACIISDVSVSTPSASVTTGTNVVFTATATANTTCTASTIQLISSGQSTGSSLTISDPGSPYYYSNAQVSASGTTKTFTATAGVADTYDYYVQTTFQTSPGSKSSATGVLRVVSPSTLAVSGTPTATQTKASGASFTMTATVTNPTNSSVSTSYNLSYSAANFTVTGDATSGTLNIGAGSSSTLSWTVALATTLTSAGDNLTLQLGDNTNAFRVTANSTAVATPVPTPVPSSSSSSSTPSSTSTPMPGIVVTPAPTAAPTATPAPTIAPNVRQLGQNSLVTGSIGGTSSTFQLSYSAGPGGFSGTLSYELPFDYQDYLDGIITFSPKPSLVHRGSVIADYAVNLVESETFKANVTVAKKLNATVLQQFTAPKAVAATPTPTATQAPTPAPTAAPVTPAPSPTAAGPDMTIIGAIILAIIIAAGAYLYLRKKA